MDSDERAVYVISVAAELAGVHPQTLRIYERRGLIRPARTEGRSRRYSVRDIALLQQIQELTNDGVNLEGVRRILDLEDRLRASRRENDRLRATVEDVRREAADAVQSVHREYRRELVPVAKTTTIARRMPSFPSRRT